MATLLYTKIGDTEAQRCDAKCYDAVTKACHCVCGGKNHGVGLEKAMQNVREDFGSVADVLVHFGGIQVAPKPELKPWPKKSVVSVPVWGQTKKRA